MWHNPACDQIFVAVPPVLANVDEERVKSVIIHQKYSRETHREPKKVAAISVSELQERLKSASQARRNGAEVCRMFVNMHKIMSRGWEPIPKGYKTNQKELNGAFPMNIFGYRRAQKISYSINGALSHDSDDSHVDHQLSTEWLGRDVVRGVVIMLAGAAEAEEWRRRVDGGWDVEMMLAHR
ncbi:hypothetical protein C8J56DRAFT_898834 [Mycena floridula]|nr:hypothetical protein C8J56DRAFT_898834 [Mycena floridula]